jgi:pathogenesis-related protein 1
MALPLTPPYLAPLVFALLAGCASPLSASSTTKTQGSGPSTTASPPAPTRMKSADVRALLTHHNTVRADVGVGPLRWDDGLAAYAQQWADQLAAGGCRMKHRQPSAYGENLFQGTAGHYTALDAAKNWESEKWLYDGGVITEENYTRVGHYTQMIWRGTTRMGCGEAICNATLLVACNYDPPGNTLGHKPY